MTRSRQKEIRRKAMLRHKEKSVTYMRITAIMLIAGSLAPIFNFDVITAVCISIGVITVCKADIEDSRYKHSRKHYSDF